MTMTSARPLLLILALIVGQTALTVTAAAAPSHKASAKPSASKSHKPHSKRHARKAVARAALPTMPTLVVPQPGLLPDMTIGNPDAKVTVTEYASAACPHCAAWNAENWDTFEAKYLVTGKVRYVFRELLTSPQEYAMAAFMTGRCAVEASGDPTNSRPYFAVLQSYYAGQVTYHETGQLNTIKTDVAKKTGLSEKAQADCVANGPKFTAFMNTMRAHTTADKVNSTPTFFVNGQRIDGNDMKDIEAAITAASK